jgi:hypothetical protein
MNDEAYRNGSNIPVICCMHLLKPFLIYITFGKYYILIFWKENGICITDMGTFRP